MRFSAIKAITGGFAFAAVLISTANAEAPAPFSQMPSDAQVVMRFDMDAMLATPQLKSIREAVPEMQNYFTGMLHEKYGGELFEDFPGQLSAIEIGMTDPSAQNDDVEYLLMYGGIDRDLVQQRIDLDETGDVEAQLTDSGVAISKDTDILAKMTSAEAGSVTSGPLSTLITKFGKSPVFVAASLTDENRVELKAAAAQMAPQAAMFPGAPAFLQEIGNLQTAALSVSEGDSVNLNLLMSFSDEETTGRAVTALNQILPGAAAMMQMMSQDPETAAMAQKIGALQFAQSGASASVAVPLPESAIATMISEIQTAQALDADLKAVSEEPAGSHTGEAASEGQSSLLIPSGERKSFPSVKTTDLYGESFDLAAHEGNVVLVDYWATWCGPCVREVPNLVSLHEEYDDKGLNIVSISLDRKEDALLSFVKKRDMTWTHIFDKGGELANMMNVQFIPTMYVLDRQGRIAAEKVRGPQLEVAVAQALSEPGGK